MPFNRRQFLATAATTAAIPMPRGSASAASEQLGANPWVKVVDNHQQNWADILQDSFGTTVVFYDDHSRVFDQLKFDSWEDAVEGLLRNRFSRYFGRRNHQEFLALPKLPIKGIDHSAKWNAQYSSGRFWLSA